jgi:hypothetical protein
MIGREFVKQLRLRNGRIETIRTRFELVANGQLVEHITIETHDRPTYPAKLKLAPAEEATEAVKRR